MKRFLLFLLLADLVSPNIYGLLLHLCGLPKSEYYYFTATSIAAACVWAATILEFGRYAAQHRLQRTAALPLPCGRDLLEIAQAFKPASPAPPLPLSQTVGQFLAQ